MKQLAIPLSNPKTVAKWLVMSSKLGVKLTQRSVIRRMMSEIRLCPECGGARVEITGGNEMRVKDLEVE